MTKKMNDTHTRFYQTLCPISLLFSDMQSAKIEISKKRANAFAFALLVF